MQQCELIAFERDRRKRQLIRIEQLLNEAEAALADLDSVSEGLSLDEILPALARKQAC